MIDIPGFEGLYATDKTGKVWSYPKHWRGKRGANHGHNGKFLKPTLGNNGYLHVILRKDKRSYLKNIHRLLAEIYIENLLNLDSINHIDGNKLNNNLSNLEWCTRGDNVRFAFQTGQRKGFPAKHDEKCTCFRCKPERRIHKGEKWYSR